MKTPREKKKSTHLPLRETLSLDSFEKILTNIIRVLTSDLLGLFPHHTSLTLQALPVEFDQLCLSIISDQTESVDTETINMAERARNSMARHSPQQGMQRARLLTEEVPRGVMRGSSLRDLTVATRLNGVDQIRELDGILDEENGNVVSNNIYA